MANPTEDSKVVNQTQDENMLAKHAAFFDRNNDGVIYPWETFQGFRAIGCSVPLSLASAIGINVGLSQITRPGKLPSIFFPIEIKNIAKSKHSSDTGVYDDQGRFVQEKFDEIFKKHAHLNPNGLNFLEVQLMLHANRKDFVGGVGSFLEWNILYFLCKDKNGLLTKDTVRGVYDGSLFVQMEKEKKGSNNKPK